MSLLLIKLFHFSGNEVDIQRVRFDESHEVIVFAYL